MSRLQLSSTFAKKNKNVTISYVNSFLITMLIVYVNSPLLKAFFHQSRVIKSFFLYITFPNNRTQEIDFTKKSYETSQILVFNTLLPTKVRMLQSKSINKDVTNCYKVKITFFEKRITIFTFFSKTNLAYKVATEIGTLFFKTSDFQNKRRYLLVAQSVQVHIFCFSNSNFTRKKDFDKCQIYLYIPAIHWFRIEIFKYIGLFFFLKSFFFFFGLPVVGIVLPLFRLQTRHYKTWDSHFAISNLENRPQKKLQVCLEVTYGTYVSLE